MNTGMKTIEWLFSEQLQVDDKWSVRTPNGFRWWADRNQQTVEVVGQETGPDEEIGYFVSVRTETFGQQSSGKCGRRARAIPTLPLPCSFRDLGAVRIENDRQDDHSTCNHLAYEISYSD